MEADTKTCPLCGEAIKAVAVRCKHCQADLTNLPAVVSQSGDFEQRFLEHAYSTTQRLDVPSVAYALKRPTAEVEERLEDMAARDVLIREIDDEGNVFFRLPGRALARRDGDALARRDGSGVPAVLPPSESTAVTALVLNVIVPGVGSLVGGRTGPGLAQLALLLVGLPLSIVLVGLPLVACAWIWALATGLRMLDESRRPPNPA